MSPTKALKASSCQNRSVLRANRGTRCPDGVSMSSATPQQPLFLVLQGVVAFLAGTHLYHVLDIVDEYLSVADVARVERAFDGFHELGNRNLAYYDLDLYFRQQFGIKPYAAIVLSVTLLHTAA